MVSQERFSFFYVLPSTKTLAAALRFGLLWPENPAAESWDRRPDCQLPRNTRPSSSSSGSRSIEDSSTQGRPQIAT